MRRAFLRVLLVLGWCIALLGFAVNLADLPYGNGTYGEIVATLIIFPLLLWAASRFRNGFALVLLLAGAALYLIYPNRSFSSEEWLDAKRCDGISPVQCSDKLDECSRLSMVRDFASRHLQIGKVTREEVRNVLGEPDEWDRKTADRDLYYLGNCGYLGVYMHLLEMRYAADGKLEQFQGTDDGW